MNDLKFAIRQLLKNPGSTAVAVLTLAIGICAVTTQFSIYRGVVLRALPLPEPDRLVRISLRDPAGAATDGVAPAFSEFIAWQREQHSCEELAAADSYRWMNVVIGGNAKPMGGLYVTHNFFSLLGIKPMMGRDFAETDELFGATPVALISHALWTRELGGAPDVVGRTIRLEGRVTTVIGVMPPGFKFPSYEEIWTPLIPKFTAESPRGQSVGIWARLKPGVSVEQALAEYNGLALRLAREFPKSNRSLTTAKVEPLHADLLGGMREMLTALLLAAIAVLGIACVNVMNLQFVRVSARLRELAMRGALGATRGQLLRQMLIEGLLLVFIGGVIGVTLTHWATGFSRAAMGQIRFGALPSWVVTELDPVVLVFTILAMAIAVLVSSILPASIASRVDAMLVLREGAHGQTNRFIGRIGSGLVTAQIGLTGALLVISLLQLKSITQHAHVDMGFPTDSVIAGRVSLEAGYRSPEARRRLYERLLRDLRQNPEFTGVAITSRSLAVGGGWTGRIEIENEPQGAQDSESVVPLECISDGYFATLGLKPIEGREFEAGEQRHGEHPVLVNRTFARNHFANGSALGRRLRVGRGDDLESEWRTVIGTVPDTHMQAFEPGRDGSGVFLPMEDSVPMYPSIVARGRAQAETLAEPLRRAIARIDPDLTLFSLATPQANLLVLNGYARVLASITTLFAAIACALAIVGIYGVAAFAVSQRTREFGVRMALGAGRMRIAGLVLHRGVVQLLIGAMAGVALAIAFVQVAGASFEGFLYQVSPHDPCVYAAALTLLGLSVICASLVPAGSAARTDPVQAMKNG